MWRLFTIDIMEVAFLEIYDAITPPSKYSGGKLFLLTMNQGAISSTVSEG